MAGPKRLHKSKRRLWGLYARWQDDPSVINEAALSDAYLRHAALAAKASLGE